MSTSKPRGAILALFLITLAATADARGALEQEIIHRLTASGGASDAARLRRGLGGRAIDAALKRMAARGAVAMEESLAEPSVRPHCQKIVELAEIPDPDVTGQLFQRAHKRRQIFEYLLGCPGRRASRCSKRRPQGCVNWPMPPRCGFRGCWRPESRVRGRSSRSNGSSSGQRRRAPRRDSASCWPRNIA